MLDCLSEELLVHTLSFLVPEEERLALTTLPCVCRPWSRTFGSDNPCFWILLAKSCGFSISGRRNVKRVFFRRQREIQNARRNEADRIIIKLGNRLKKNDCPAVVRKQLDAYYAHASSGSININLAHHPVGSLENRCLLHLACWWGRAKTVKFLLEEFGSYYKNEDTNALYFQLLDDSNASPLLIAAWAGHASVVRLLLNHLAKQNISSKQQFSTYMDTKGVPPLTSSCGGRGPKTAICWAERKGFSPVVRLLERAGASTGHRNSDEA